MTAQPQTGRNSYLWHLEQAAIQQQLGDRNLRHAIQTTLWPELESER